MAHKWIKLNRTPLMRVWAAVALASAILACNAPGRNTTPTPAVVSTPIEPAASETPAPLDPLVILDTYESLAGTRDFLNRLTFTMEADGVTDRSGRQLLEWILVERAYDPRASNADKQSLFDSLDAYIWPNPGARMYLINVATGLFAEAHHFYPWSLRDYSQTQIANLFIQDDSLAWQKNDLHHGDVPPGMPNTVSHWYPSPDLIVEEAHYKQFNLARRLAEGSATQEDAIHAVMAWTMQNFFHAYAPGYGWEVYLDGQEPRTDGGAVAYPLNLERVYEERVSGCHEPTIIMEGMLHSLNIPAVRLSMQGHGVLYLPTLERFVHGDHIVGQRDAPPEVLMLTADEIRPFAENEAFIFDIVYPRKYSSPFLSMPLYRDGGSLYILNENVRDFSAGTCLQVSEADLARVSSQLSAYNLKYDSQTCTLTSDRLPIQTLDQLADPTP
ncbi:MAG TPA: hypothetical protein VGJ22_14390 [Anaerolineales bacterium]|jgi:hypothetical protein